MEDADSHRGRNILISVLIVLVVAAIVAAGRHRHLTGSLPAPSRGLAKAIGDRGSDALVLGQHRQNHIRALRVRVGGVAAYSVRASASRSALGTMVTTCRPSCRSSSARAATASAVTISTAAFGA